MICAFCEGEWDANDNGAIILMEQSPAGYRDEDESYNMCSYKCLKRWLDL